MITRSDSKSGLYPSPETSQPGIARRFGDIEPSLWPKLRSSMMYCACAADIAIVDQASARRLHGDIYILKEKVWMGVICTREGRQRGSAQGVS
jgi:hypothetical protein